MGGRHDIERWEWFHVKPSVWMFHVKPSSAKSTYLPIQNFEKISPSKSSDVNSPVMADSAS